MVVRKGSKSFDPLEKGPYLGRPRTIGTRTYLGVDRMPWFDIWQDHYTKRLPSTLSSAFADLRLANKDFSGLYLTRSIDFANELLCYTNRESDDNEIIALRSRRLEEIKGTVVCSSAVEWLGFDVFIIGGWSLLKDGVFLKPLVFGGWHQKLNDSGLFATSLFMQSYLSDYKSAAARGEVEEIPGDEWIVDAIEVGSVNAQNCS